MRIQVDPDLNAPDKSDRNSGLGPVMRELRRRAKKTQEDAGEAMGVERTSVCNIEAGTQAVTIEKLCRFANLVGVDVVVTFKPRARGKAAIQHVLEAV